MMSKGSPDQQIIEYIRQILRYEAWVTKEKSGISHWTDRGGHDCRVLFFQHKNHGDENLQREMGCHSFTDSE